ncbi:MAG: hypothetical protein COB49_05295 [Alphaproteobacteria bacterium]|nr:MAG: hypothetical protein COB49_05295 [Alphaproteobacteria bacterium]
MGNSILSVIIPFFQKKTGLITKAVQSVFNQQNFDDFDIIVVDDGSPVSAKEELASLLIQYPEKLKIIEQVNQGPGAARNTGLNSLPQTREYVAFLDSDDIWEPVHLKNALDVLNRGYDFYFSNLFHIGRDISAFDREQKIKYPTRLRSHEMKPIDGLDEKYEFLGDMFDRILFSGNILLPPTIVYKFSSYPETRFQTSFRHMGEDYIFFADLAMLKPKYAFSWTPEVRCGRGVNIFVNSGWGSDTFLDRLCDEMRFRRQVEQRFSLTEEQQLKNNQKIQRIRKDFVRALFGHCKRAQFHKLAKISKIQKDDGHFFQNLFGGKG